MENYQKIDIVGEGTYGKVYKAKDRRSKNIVALKKIPIESSGVPATAIREIALLKEIKHCNVIELLDIQCSDNNLYLVFEYLNFDMRKYMDRYKEGLPPALVQSYMYQLLKGIAYCHSHCIVHRDLKPPNILIDNEGNIKIADFGLSRVFRAPSETCTHEVVTLWYRCPEILLGAKFYGFGVDIWSLACIFAEMANKKILFQGESEIDQLFKIFKLLGTPSEKTWSDVDNMPHYRAVFPKWAKQNLKAIFVSFTEEAVDLIQGMLTYDPKARISARQALNHRYFDQLKDLAIDN